MVKTHICIHKKQNLNHLETSCKIVIDITLINIILDFFFFKTIPISHVIKRKGGHVFVVL